MTVTQWKCKITNSTLGGKGASVAEWLVSVMGSGAEGPDSNRSRDAVQ